jgi:hypothetical protein
VLDAEGHALSSILITADGVGDGGAAYSDLAGRFVIRGLAPGTFTVSVQSREPAFEPLEGVGAGATDVVLRALAPAFLAGRAPPGVIVHAFREDKDLLPASGRYPAAEHPLASRVDEHGRFRIDGLAGPTFTVWIEDRARAFPVLRGVVPGTDDLVLEEIAEPATIEGVVTGLTTGQTARVYVEPADGRGATRTVESAATGGFTIEGLVPGVTYVLIASANAPLLRSERAMVHAGARDLAVPVAAPAANRERPANR